MLYQTILPRLCELITKRHDNGQSVRARRIGADDLWSQFVESDFDLDLSARFSQYHKSQEGFAVTYGRLISLDSDDQSFSFVLLRFLIHRSLQIRGYLSFTFGLLNDDKKLRYLLSDENQKLSEKKLSLLLDAIASDITDSGLEAGIIEACVLGISLMSTIPYRESDA